MGITKKRNKTQNKKGQVTIFIIVGLLLLLIVGLGVYFSAEMFKYAGLDDQFVPVAVYTEQCIEDVALEAIFIAGMQGGYIDPPFEEEAAYLEAGFPITYWFLAGEDRSVAPPRLEAELETYIEEHINDCLTDYSSFKSQFTVTPINKINLTADVDIDEDEVRVKLDIPVQMTDATATVVLPTVEVEIQNSIGKKLFLAYQIMKTENEENFLEFYTDEIIAASAWLPYEGFDMTCKPKRWYVNEMEDYVEQAVAVNLPFIMFKGTDYEVTGDPYYDKIYLVDPHASGVKDLSVTTTYDPNWGMDLDVQPNDNGVVTNLHMVGQTVAVPCIKVYHHRYSTYFPVLFTITDDDDSNYPFYFATPVIMKRNEGDRYAEMQVWPSETDALRNAEFCSETISTTAYSVKADGTIEAEQIEEDRRPYGLDVIAMDALYGFDGILEDVTITYECGQFSCNVGTTEYGSGNVLVTYPLLSTDFPSCLNGQIIAEKEGYHPARVSQTVSEISDGSTVHVPMYRVKPLDVDFALIVNHNNVIDEAVFEEEDLVVVTIKNEEERFEKVVVWPTEGEGDDEATSAAGFDTMELLVAPDITYELNIKLIQDEIYTGGLVYNWTPDANALTAAIGVRFYVVKKDILLATDENYKEAMEYAQEASMNYPPEFW
jgi:hypothetical protein